MVAALAAPSPLCAIEPAAPSQSTLDAHVSPRSDLDATIASMVRRGLITEVSTPSAGRPSEVAQPRVAMAPTKPAYRAGYRGRTQWRSAGQGNYSLSTPRTGTPAHVPPPP
ncbi:MAG TPA: hypothetical protein VF175_12535, partial [Lacipirellula sp.]